MILLGQSIRQFATESGTALVVISRSAFGSLDGVDRVVGAQDDVGASNGNAYVLSQGPFARSNRSPPSQ